MTKTKLPQEKYEVIHTVSTKPKIMNPSFYLSTAYLRPIFDFLQSRQLPIQDFLDTVGLSEADILEGDTLIADDNYDHLLRYAAITLDDPQVGLHIGQSMQFHHLGILGLLILTCRKSGEVFRLHERYQKLVGNGLQSRYLRENDEFILESKRPPGAPAYCRHSYEFNLGGWLNLRQILVGSRGQLTRAELPYPRPENAEELETLLQAPVKYDCDRLRIYFPVANAELELMAAEPQLHALLEAQASQRLAKLQQLQTDTNPFIARIKHQIVLRLSHGVPSVEAIAASEQLSVRTLQRQLDMCSTDYTSLIEQVRLELTQLHISDATLSLFDLAMILGFSEQSSFQRAFKRWFGQTPGQYRKAQSTCNQVMN